MKLTIIRIKPNPAGKDRPPHGGPSPAQLAAEWIDFRNEQGQDVSLNGVSLWHLTTSAGSRIKTATLTLRVQHRSDCPAPARLATTGTAANLASG